MIKGKLRPILILLILTLYAVPILAQERPKIKIFAHYCNWHVKNQETSTWRNANTIPLRHTPPGMVGYDSLDRRMIGEHNAEMEANNIIPLVSWWGPDVFSGDEFLQTYLRIESSVKIGILYEITSRLIGSGQEKFNFDNPENVERFIKDMTHLHEKFFSRFPQRFYKIDGRPVVFMWLTHAFTGRFDLALQRLRETVPVYIIGSDINIFGYFRPDLLDTVRGMDAISAYGIYAPDLAEQTKGELTREYVDKYAKSLKDWKLWIRENVPETKMIVPVEFMYKDNRDNPELRSTPEQAVYLLQKVQEFFMLSKYVNVLPYILVVSYNEHYEGTGIEPTVEYGSFYLDLLRISFKE